MGIEKLASGREGKAELEKCPDCKGEGYKDDNMCRRCKGTGKLPSAR